MLRLYENIKNRREELGMSQQELADKTGYTSRSSIAKIEAGERDIPQSKIISFADALSTTPSSLMGWESAGNPDVFQYPNIIPIGEGSYVPLYGRIACGEPMLAVEELEEYAWMPDGVRADFALTCDGDSMTGARIYDGDIVYIKEMPMVDNGEIAAVIVRDESVTLKRVYYYPKRNELQLRAENPMYETQIYMGEELDHVRILGKAVHFLAPVK